MRAMPQRDWAAALDALPEANPLYVFRDMFRLGLGGIDGHAHANATAALALEPRGVVAPRLLAAEARPYTQADVDAMVQYLLEVDFG